MTHIECTFRLLRHNLLNLLAKKIYVMRKRYTSTEKYTFLLVFNCVATSFYHKIVNKTICQTIKQRKKGRYLTTPSKNRLKNSFFCTYSGIKKRPFIQTGKKNPTLILYSLQTETKKTHTLMSVCLAAGSGFEPEQNESESLVLPLHNPAMSFSTTYTIITQTS